MSNKDNKGTPAAVERSRCRCEVPVPNAFSCRDLEVWGQFLELLQSNAAAGGKPWQLEGSCVAAFSKHCKVCEKPILPISCISLLQVCILHHGFCKCCKCLTLVGLCTFAIHV